MSDSSITAALTRDVGCAYSPSCLKCQWSLCYHDDAHGFQAEVKRVEAQQIRVLVEETGLAKHKAVLVVAERLGYRPRTIYRALRRV